MSYKDYTQKNAPWDSDSWTEDERTQWAQDDTAYRDYGVTRCLGCMELHSREYEICPECGYVSGMMPENPLHIYPGTYLKNRYIIGKVIGSGGFGITYIAWDTLLKTKVAVKEYLPSEFSTRSSGQTKVTVFTGDKTVQFTDGKDKFVDEAKRLAKFQNESGIVKIFDSFEENNTAYIIMEYLDGCTLGEYLDMNGKMDADKAIELITPVIESLNSVHEVGIIHRDVAPDNIFVTKNGDVKLIDFGASRYATTSKSRSLSVLIKPGYSPEEQYRSRGDQGAHTDVYSLAATLYKMITGVTPPDALERRAFYEKKKKDILEPITKYNKEITDNQQAAIYNALNIKIEDRTPNTVTLLGELTSETKVKRNKGTLKKIDPLTWPLWLKIGIPAALVVFITLGILLATGVIGPKRNVQVRLKDGYVEMPDYIGMNCEEAANDLANLTDYKGNPANLELSRKDYIQGGREGTVVKTEPSGGMAVKMGISPEEKSVIYYYESEGTPVTVPYIHGIPYDEAIFVDFEITVIILHSNVQSGCIISAEINGIPVYGGSNAQKYDNITVYVSDGPENPDMGGTVIDFTGMTFSEAMMEAEKHNLCIRADEAAGQSNTVVGQSVAPGRWVSSGEVIVLSFKEDSTRVIPAYWDGKNKNTLKAELIRAGFTNVELVAGGDVGYGQDTVYEMRDGDGNIINGNDRLHKDTVIILYYDPTPDVVAESVDREEVTETEYVAEPETTRRQPTEPPVTEPETEYYYPEEESSDYDYDYTEYPSHGYSEVYTEYPTEDPWPDERPTETVYKQYWFDYNHENASVPELYVLSLYDSLPSAYRDGYEFLGWFTGESAGEEIYDTYKLFTNENVKNNTVYAHWRTNSYSLTFSNGTGYSVTVKRTSSPSGKPTGTLSSGDTIYHGDVLSITYTASSGYTITSKGATSITVSDDVGSNEIYATATVNNRTFNVTYKSTNGTNLGNTTVTVPYGESKTITPPAKAGYITPAAKTVNGSSSNTNVVFEYSVKTPSNTSESVPFQYTANGGTLYETFYYVIEFRNRTVNSVEVRVTMKHSIKQWGIDPYRYDVSITGPDGTTKSATVVPANTWVVVNGHGVSHDDSRTKSTGWITITGLSPTQTTVPVRVKYWMHNGGADNVRINKTVNANIPTY